MAKTLVVVESPAKAKTIKKYLGPGFEVLASKGHVKDLPKSGKDVIDIAKGFKERYEVIEGKERVLAELKAAAKAADFLVLATDPDREGEAIAYHLADELTCKGPTSRVEFHEITKAGVKRGIDNPRALDENLYDAQRCRRVLDRIVGYDVSSLLWKKLAFGLSAGRVQSVALRLIVDREREIQAFVPVEYWNMGAHLVTDPSSRFAFLSRLSHKDGRRIEVVEGKTAGAVKKDLGTATYQVTKVTKTERRRRPTSPYTTSKIQQDAANRLGFGAKRTMQIAQGLYEGVDLGKTLGTLGLITYMRTDSTRVAPEAIAELREYIGKEYGAASVPASPNVYKSKGSAQEAHEAIRPTSIELTPERVQRFLKEEQYKLYKLVWDRFVASQMSDAIYDQTAADITATAKGANYTLRASGRVLKFAGWLAAYGVGQESPVLAGEEETPPSGERKVGGGEEEDGELPALNEAMKLFLKAPPGVLADQKFTQPPPRFNEGSLVRELEERGIGRPSTYAETISKVQARDYVEKVDGGRTFRPSELGTRVIDGLMQGSMGFMDPAFTSALEEELDAVSTGKEKRVDLLNRFYAKFKTELDAAAKGERWAPAPEDTGEECDKCHAGNMMKRWSKNGWFLGCSNYSAKVPCKNTRNLGTDGEPEPVRETQYVCDLDGKPMVIRSGRYGEFLACSGYPECKNAKPIPLGVPCPKCGGDLIEIKSKKRGARSFFGCANYAKESVKCDFKLWQRPIPTPCPDCSAAFVVAAGTKAKPMRQCVKEGCSYKAVAPPPEEQLLAAGE